MTTAEFGPRLKEVRVAAGLTRQDLAHRYGRCEARTVWLWETGRMEPKLSAVLRLAVALGVEPGELLRPATCVIPERRGTPSHVDPVATMASLHAEMRRRRAA